MRHSNRSNLALAFYARPEKGTLCTITNYIHTTKQQNSTKITLTHTYREREGRSTNNTHATERLSDDRFIIIIVLCNTHVWACMSDGKHIHSIALF